MKSTVERFIKQIVKDKCKDNEYMEKFGTDMQNEIKDRCDVIAKITLEDKDFMTHIEDAIEESIRIMILRKAD